MLLDDRRIVLTLEAICWCSAALVFFQQTDFPSAISILPFLMGVLIHIEYPPAGRGVGTVADAAPDLLFEDEHSKHGPAVFDKEGGLLRGHAYVLTFLRKTSAATTQTPSLNNPSPNCRLATPESEPEPTPPAPNQAGELEADAAACPPCGWL